MLFRTVVLLTSRVNLLMKGVAPAVWPVIRYRGVICLMAPATWVRTMKTVPMMINEHVFIGRIFLISPDWVASVSNRAVRVQKKISRTRNLFFGRLPNSNAVRSRHE
jgi:hypothetical protein